MNGPSLLLADEPTGNLDQKSGHAIVELFRHLVDESQVTLLVATHDEKMTHFADRALSLVDGNLSAPNR